MIKSILNLLVIIGVAVLIIFAYQTKGHVDIRWQGFAISMKMGTLLLILLLGMWILFYVFSFIKYLGRLSKNLKEYWHNRHQTEGLRYMEEAISAFAGGAPELALKKARKACDILKESLFAKLVYALITAENGAVIDERLFNSLTKSKYLGLAGYRLRIEQLLKQGDRQTALVESHAALERYPSVLWLLETVFKLYIHQNDPYQALDICKKLRQMGLPDAESKMALCYILQSKTESDRTKKIKHLQAAFDLDKTNPVIGLELAQEHMTEDRLAKARLVIETTWKYSHHPALGDLYLQTLDDVNSDEVLEGALKLLDISNASLEGYVVVIKACIHCAFYQKARYYLEKAIQANGGMSYKLFELRVALTQKDGAETLDYYSWIQQVAMHKRFEGWECATCHAQLPQWEPECLSCGSVNSYFWQGEHEHENTFFAIKGA